MYNTTIILDAGHGQQTLGKRSPDGSLLEYKWAREIVDKLARKLEEKGLKVVKLVPEETDIPLSERVKRANKISNAILISIHCNAAGSDGQWHAANGWSVFIGKNASNNSKRLASCICDNITDIKIRKPSPNQKYWEQSLAICRDTKCPAVLTENMFQDNKEDVKFLLSDEGKQKIIDAHYNGILDYLK